MTSTATIVIFTITSIVMLSGEIFAVPPTQCSPGFLDEVPPRIRKICAALSTIYELSSVMENYIDDNVPVLRDIPLPDRGVKRHDVDHVFLRFGRRR